MIRIKKSATIPKPLDGPDSLGGTATELLIEAVAQNVDPLKFSNSIYGHDKVKDQLKRDQHGKCDFCEGKILAHNYGDVEHFRPKAGWKQTATDKKIVKPGYYWLAYAWSNMMLSCTLCNQRHKGNIFPLRNPKSRAKSNVDKLSREKPVFIDPTTEDPGRFIVFKAEVCVGIDPEGRGEKTIEALGLNRPDLLEDRRERLEKVDNTLRTFESQGQLTKEVSIEIRRNFLEQCIADTEEYAAMHRCALAAM